MDSYPQQRNQVPFAQCYYPSYDGMPPQMILDQAKYPVMYGPWPHGSDYGYMIPCHACSNHINFPGYYCLRPPFSHFAPSPSLYSCGHHPVFTEPYHAHYPSPSHPPVEQPRYEYDKSAKRDYHCCGCPNHTCTQRSDKGVKIEEQEPDIVTKSDSMVPLKSKNYPYPIMWIPPEYMKKNNEYARPFETEVVDQKKVSRNTKSQENVKSTGKEPSVWSGWFPLDTNNFKSLMQDESEKEKCDEQNEDKMRQLPYPIIWMPSSDDNEGVEKDDKRKMNDWFPLNMNGLKSLMQSEDDKGRQNQQNEDKMRRFPYPIIWMPSHSDQRQADKKDKGDMNAAPNVEEPPSSFKFIPVKPAEIDNSMHKFGNKKISGGQAESSQMMENSANQKLNSVKKVEVQRKEDNSEEVNYAPPKYVESLSTDNSTGTGVRKQSSPQKTSKLPPVCLRVEPLSRKKNGDGSPRSPSPPGFNERLPEKGKDTSRISASSSLKKNMPHDTQARDCFMNKSKKVEPTEAEKKIVDLVGGKTCENRNEDRRRGSQMENSVKSPMDYQEDAFNKSSTKGTRKDNDKCKFEEGKVVGRERDMAVDMASEANRTSGSAEAADGECTRRIKNLSAMEAATLIQSAYRGYEVRKMEPLKKLKQMAEVREQVGEVRNRIQALESSSDTQKTGRERDLIGEMIMRLLLKLDTIQGLHPSLRDIRKALARELVSQQEKLDSLAKRKSKETSKPADDPSIETHNDVSTQDMQNKEAGIVENSFQTSGNNSTNMKEQDRSQLSQMVHSESQDTSEPSLASKEMHGRCENEIRELPVASDVEYQVVESAPNMELKDKAANADHDANQVVMREMEEIIGVHPELEQLVTLPLVSEEKTSSEELMGALPQDCFCDQIGEEDEAKVAKASGAIHVDDNLPVNGLKELPLKLIDEEPAGSELEKYELVGEEQNEIVDDQMESTMLPRPNLSTNVGDMIAKAEDEDKTATTKEPGTNLLVELPLGLIEDDPAVSAYEKHKEIGTEKNETLCSGEASYNEATNVTALMEAEDLAKVMLEELPRDAELEVEEVKPLPSITGEERSDEPSIDEDRNEGMIGVDHMPSLETAIKNDCTQEVLEKKLQSKEPKSVIEVVDELPSESKSTKEEDLEQKPNGKKEEEVLEKKPQCKEPKRVIEEVDDLPSESENTKEEDQEQKANGKIEEEMLEKKPQCKEPKSIIDNEVDEQPSESESTKEDVLVATPTFHTFVDEKDMVMEREKKLIEEHARLREMMEKLMEAGKEQLTVISNLTGRVKDLERKLSRKKKQRTRSYRKSPSTLSRTKLFNGSTKARGVNVAM